MKESSTELVTRRRRGSRSCATMLLGLSVALAHSMLAQTDTHLSGQPANPNRPTISVTSRLVVLDVVVTDAKGQPVAGLTKDDFTILQDGKPEIVRSFDAWNDRAAAAPSPTMDRFGRQEWGTDVPLTIFVLDEMNTPFDEKSFAVENLRNYLRAQPTLLASPAMLVTVNYTGLNTLASYTRDRDTLLHALARRPPALPAQSGDLELASITFAMLRQIALATEGLHTHKSIIWLGRGFPALDPTDYDDPSNAVLKKAIEDTVNLLISARVTVYQVDPITTEARTEMANIDVAMSAGASIGSHMASTGTGDLLDATLGFNRFVLATGGQLYYGRNDLNKFLADAELRSNEFYTLSYVPPGAVDTSVYRTISVHVRDPSLHADTRQGFYSSQGPGPEPDLKNLGFDLKLASTGAMTFSSVATRISSVTAARTPGKIAIGFSVEDNSLQWVPREVGGDAAKILVLLVSLDKDRNIQSSAASTLNLAVKNPADVATAHLQTTEEIGVNAKTCSVRLVVRDSSGRIGTADVDHSMLASIPSGRISSRCDARELK